MQIDFHHAVTYVCARLAGFSADESRIIAHSAQYVDDATAAGEIWFDNGMIFPRMASAHKMLDYNNMNKLSNHRVWLPFHFLPGNNDEAPLATLPAYDPEEFMHRCVCLPNSHPARELMKCVVERHDRPYALYRLGIAAHVFMDTWAHQGFVGFQHSVNVARDIEAGGTRTETTFTNKVITAVKNSTDKVKSWFVGTALPLGHGSVLSYPDHPYLRWSYRNGRDQHVDRDNPMDFLEAAQETFKHFARYREYPVLGEAVFAKDYPLPDTFSMIEKNISLFTDEDGVIRHRNWLASIRNGDFGFADQLDYVDKGDGSWKSLALGTNEDVAHMGNSDRLRYLPHFPTSHWKLFHDALQAHRFFVMHELLPRYGLLNG